MKPSLSRFSTLLFLYFILDEMINHLPTRYDPFGPLLSPLHHYVIRTAEPITWPNAHQVALIPLLPLGLQAYLLQYEGTRKYRIAIGLVGLSLMVNAWIGYRFDRTSSSDSDSLAEGDSL